MLGLLHSTISAFQKEVPKKKDMAAARPINGHTWNQHGITLPYIFYGSKQSPTQPGAKWEQERNHTKVQMPAGGLHCREITKVKVLAVALSASPRILC